jgi:hypothetical protein
MIQSELSRRIRTNLRMATWRYLEILYHDCPLVTHCIASKNTQLHYLHSLLFLGKATGLRSYNHSILQHSSCIHRL